ncbi:hypothetical protein F511_40193 [Dorcoceras hygrometricum]|uniref:Uncharacterized protein n=1 Tax=Dorcoceras hygrometricum TaxID=472368 RepID=A0A2Z7BQD4_9LAMI|nr:hypothetical protein F511_40193 [Dorcoceras hygrometricum]
MRMNFSGTDVLFKAPNKKKEMKMEYGLLHDIVAKALCAKGGSFDVVTSENFDLMVVITAGLKAETQPGPIPDIPAEDEAVSTTADPKANMETTPEVDRHADDGSTGVVLE